MGKYDLNINMNNRNSSHTLILEQIEPNKMVLECGCATGYMTKYMAEKLNCVVHVVEKDMIACQKASEYATDWYCGDLNNGEWKDYYEEHCYNYILFADVLEHLKDPLTTLTMATELLRKDGKVIISIPNICHNDIIVQLFNDNFRYTDLGLLDSTHIHFWGRNDFERFVDKAGLKIADVKTVVFPTQGTEQRSDSRVNDELMSLLKKRPYGEVYQWIFTCERMRRMPDREKVIKGLQAHADGCGYRSHHCDVMECPYRYGDESCDIEEMCRDALALLKEQEDDKPKGHWVPYEPDKRGYTDGFTCSRCERVILSDHYCKMIDFDFCPYCGAYMDNAEGR